MEGGGCVGSPQGCVTGLQQKWGVAEAEAASAVPDSRRRVNGKEGTSLCGEEEERVKSVRGSRTRRHTHTWDVGRIEILKDSFIKNINISFL